MGLGSVCPVCRLLCLVVRALAGAVPCPPPSHAAPPDRLPAQTGCRHRSVLASLCASHANSSTGKALLCFRRGEETSGWAFLSCISLAVCGGLGGYVCGEG